MFVAATNSIGTRGGLILQMIGSRMEEVLTYILGKGELTSQLFGRIERLLLTIHEGGEWTEETHSRVEDILVAILNGERYEEETHSRIEEILKAKANGETFEHQEYADLSRIEALLLEWLDDAGITISGALPLTFKTSSDTLLDYKIYGNTVNEEGVGVKTENLWSPSTPSEEGRYIDSSGTLGTDTGWIACDYVGIDSNEQYTFSVNTTPGALAHHAFYDSNGQFISAINSGTQTFITPNDAAYARFSYRRTTTEITLTEGSTPLDTYIYIGDTQLMQDEYVSYSEQAVHKSISLYGIEDNIDTLDLSTGILTRKVKKIVLNGTEDFGYQRYTYTASFVLDIPDISLLTFRVFSNYFQGSDSLPVSSQRRDKIFVTLHQSYKRHAIAIGSATWGGDVNAFKDFLAEKYASGNPVTVWYVLESPEITNLPVSSQASGTLEGYLAQDGVPSHSNPIYPTYARTHYPTNSPVPLPQLPTFTDTDTVIDYEETPAPEEVELTYKP